MKKFRRMTRSNQFKVVLLVIGAAFVIWLLTSIVPYKAQKFSVKITVDCDNIGTVWCTSSLGGKKPDSNFIDSVNPEAPFERGEVVSIDFPASLFENAGRLRVERFEFALAVFDSNGEGHPVRCEGTSFLASFGNEYSYTLTCDNGEYYCA